MPILIILSILAVLIGLLFLSNATTGVGLICLGCYLAILARIAQAGSVKKQSSGALESLADWASQSPPKEPKQT